MKKRFLFLLALSLVLVFALAACAADAEPEDRTITVGFSQIGSESDWRIGNTVSVRTALEGAGWDVLFNDANQQQHLQIQAIRDFITQGVDYIVLAPIVETGWDAIIREIEDAGIPWIQMDRGIDMPGVENSRVSWITNNFEDEGRRAGEWLIAYLEHTGRMGDSINIVELQGTVGSSAAIDRQRGFAEMIAGHPNLEITQSQTGDFTTELGMVVMEAFLGAADRPIDVLFAHNDGMALGAIQAIREAGLTPGEDIIIIGVDAVALAFEAIVEGNMNVTVECSPLLGPTVVEVIQAHIDGQPIEPMIFSSVRVFDETLSNVMPDRFLSAADDLPNRVY